MSTETETKLKRIRLICGVSSDFDNRCRVVLNLTADSVIWTTYKRLKAAGIFELPNFYCVELFEQETIWLSHVFPDREALDNESLREEALDIEANVQDEQEWFAVPEGLLPEEIPQEWQAEKIVSETMRFCTDGIYFTSELKNADVPVETAVLSYEALTQHMLALDVS